MNAKKYLRRKWVKLYGRIVREKASPEYIARGWAIGMFCGCLIPLGGQLLCSIPAAFLLRGSKVGAVAGTLLTNHFTILFIYPVQCYVGSRMLGGILSYEAIREALSEVLRHQSYADLMHIGGELLAAFFAGGALLTAVMTPLTYYTVKKWVIHYRLKKANFNRKADS